MTVQELIEKLQQFPPTHLVFISDGDYTMGIESVTEDFEPGFADEAGFVSDEYVSQGSVTIKIK